MAAYAALTSLNNLLHQIQNHTCPPISIEKQLESLTKTATSLQQLLETYHPLEMRIADAAYAALTSLMQLIHQLQHHPSPPISIEQQQVESLIEIVTFLQEFLEGYNSPVADGDEADPLEMRIADAAYEAQDVIESHIVDVIQMRRSTVHPDMMKRHFGAIITTRFPPLRQFRKIALREIPSTSAGLKRKSEMPVIELRRSTNHPDMMKPHFEDIFKPQFTATRCQKIAPPEIPSTSAGLKRKSEMSFNHLVQKVIIDMNLIKGGIKKDNSAVEAQLQSNVSTSAASSRSSSIMVGFDDVLLEILDKLTTNQLHRQVIPIVGMGGIGKTTLAKSVFENQLTKRHFDICVWATISQQYDTKEILCDLLSQANKKSKEQLRNMSEDELGLQLHKYLFGRRFLIVMDDMWSVEPWEKMRCYFPDNRNSSRIVVTTRLSTLGSQLDNYYCLKMKFLDYVSCWTLFSKTVFGEESCPPELKKIGEKIVETCKGLPLSVVVMGGLLRNLEQTQECWESIRKNSSSVGNSENEDFCLKILKLSYNHLPVYLKPCFLYMGVFEEDRAIRVSTLVKLWISEGFLKRASGKSLETAAREYLNDLVERNLILVHELGCIGNIKYCKIHDLLRDLCWREAGKEGFYTFIGKHKFQGLNNRQRSVVIPGRTSREEVDDASRSMPLARSFVCDSNVVVPLPESRMMRTLKAYDMDTSGSHDYLLHDLFRFVNSRYLAVGVRQESIFHSSVGLLWNLQTLVVLHPLWISAPREIWEMSQLRHVEFHKGELRLPYLPIRKVVVMKNLQTLKGVNDLKCKEASMIIPNIKKLGVVTGIPSNLICLSKLESYCLWDFDHAGICDFPQSLKKLSLGRNSSHWVLMEDMLERIGALPHLQKLKLERARFQRCKLKEWKTSEDRFPSLKYLKLKWCILESWMTESSHFPRLEQLHLHGLIELEEIPCEIGEISTLQSILLEYCGESVVESAKKIADEQEELQVRVVLFNTDKNQALRSRATPNFLVAIVDFY